MDVELEKDLCSPLIARVRGLHSLFYLSHSTPKCAIKSFELIYGHQVLTRRNRMLNQERKQLFVCCFYFHPFLSKAANHESGVICVLFNKQHSCFKLPIKSLAAEYTSDSILLFSVQTKSINCSHFKLK